MCAYCDISRRGRLCVLIVTSVGGGRLCVLIVTSVGGADCVCLL